MERPFRSVAPQRPRWNTRRCRWTMRIVCPHWARSSRYVDNVEKFCRRVSVDVRFAPESGHRADMPACPLCAKSGQTHRSKSDPYSITLSARARSVAGTATPRITRRQIARVHASFDNACPLSRLLDHPAVLSHATAAADRLRQRGSRALDKPRALCRC